MHISPIGLAGYDDESSIVAGYVVDETSLLTLRFSIDSPLPASLQSRIVNRFFGNEVSQELYTFRDRHEMRETVMKVAFQLIPSCMVDPCINAPNVIVDVKEDEQGNVSYSLCHEVSLYKSFLSCLKPLKDILPSSLIDSSPSRFVDRSSLRIVSTNLDGHNTAAVVRDPFDANPATKEKYFFKGQHFSDFLIGQELCANMINAQYNEIATLYAMPPHPNILRPSHIFVTTPAAQSAKSLPSVLLCGMLQPYFVNGDLEVYLQENTASIQLKAKWCLQLVSAIRHTHFVGHLYHMDLKPSNMLLDDDLDLIVIDWENSGANKAICPPEADGSFDVYLEQLASGKTKLKYEKYTGPERRNSTWSRPTWNVFPIWNKECRRALELAQVYSLGRTMWMILTSTPSDELGSKDIWWTSEAEGSIPVSWRETVDHCLCKDPNARMGLEDLLQFWKGIAAPR